MPLLYLMTIFVDANGRVAFASQASDGTGGQTTPTVTLKRNDYLRFRIGNNLSGLPTGSITINPKRAIPFASGARAWAWPPQSGDFPSTPECVLWDAALDSYGCGLVVVLADGSAKVSEITIKIV